MRLEKIEFAGIRGQALSDLVAEMYSEFTELSGQFQGQAKDPLNITDNVREGGGGREGGRVGEREEKREGGREGEGEEGGREGGGGEGEREGNMRGGRGREGGGKEGRGGDKVVSTWCVLGIEYSLCDE